MWISVTLQADATKAEALSDALMEAGALSVSIEDADAGTEAETPQFGEPGHLPTSLWDHSRVIALVDGNTDDAALVALLTEASEAAGFDVLPPYTTEQVAEQNWVQLTQSQFDPIRISTACGSCPRGTRHPIRRQSTSSSIRAWPSAPVRTRPPGCASNGCVTASPRLQRARLWLRLGHPRHRGSQAGRGRRTRRRYRREGGRGRTRQRRTQRHDNPSAALGYAGRRHLRHRGRQHPDQPLVRTGARHCRARCAGGKVALSGVLETQAEQVIEAWAPFIALQVGAAHEGWIRLEGQRPAA